LELLDSNGFVLSYGNEIIELNKISCFWHRTSFHNFNSNYYSFNCLNEKFCKSELSQILAQWLHIEHVKLLQTTYHHLMTIPHLSNPSTYDINRISVLLAAKNMGLKTPKWIITTAKSKLLKFVTKNHRVITKPIGWNVFFNADNYNYTLYTTEICLKHINDFPEKFAPSFFQQLIQKKIELRVFYLDGEFYTMAFYPLLNKTSVDIRENATDLSHRKLPFMLPFRIKQKLIKLMNLYKLKTASIDMIYGTDKNFYFLEINPTGQFEYLNDMCNFSLDKKIANFLCKKYD
jgi:hypothetical protein